jgi:hypothetical protein
MGDGPMTISSFSPWALLVYSLLVKSGVDNTVRNYFQHPHLVRYVLYMFLLFSALVSSLATGKSHEPLEVRLLHRVSLLEGAVKFQGRGINPTIQAGPRWFNPAV